MKIQTLYSEVKDVVGCIADIKNKNTITSPAMVLYFSSSIFNPGTVAYEMKHAFPGATTFGCTTAGELVSGLMLKESIVVMIFSREVIEESYGQFVYNISEFNNVAEAFKKLSAKVGQNLSSLPFEKYVGMVLIDGMSAAEEKIMDSIGNLSNISFVGASAGDDMKFKTTHVMLDGEAKNDSALLVLLKPRNGYDIIKSQAFHITNRTLIPTKVDEKNRTVLEFNDKPAIEAYAEANGTTVEKAHLFFPSNPLGLVIEGEPFVRSPQRIEGTSIIFYCQIKKGVMHYLLEPKNIVTTTQDDLNSYLEAPESISGMINFNCIQRTLELEKKEQVESYGNIFKNIPMIGFSTYGEEYLGHINQTSIFLIFR